MVKETFHGYVETTQDVLLIFEGCKRGILPRVGRRLQESERKMIRSGSIFVFDEQEAGIKRWTDGRVWSPSRILGNFLIYRELDKNNSSPHAEKERHLVGCLSDSYSFKRNGLVKKTMSITVNNVPQHFISYYDPQDVIEEKLHTTSSIPELASLHISSEFLCKQNFRIPPKERSIALDLDRLLNPIHIPQSK